MSTVWRRQWLPHALILEWQLTPHTVLESGLALKRYVLWVNLKENYF